MMAVLQSSKEQLNAELRRCERRDEIKKQKMMSDTEGESGVDAIGVADDETIFKCWCGASGTYEMLFCDEGLDDCCAGTGRLQCRCGGDFCICCNHGEIECPGCPDCNEEHC